MYTLWKIALGFLSGPRAGSSIGPITKVSIVALTLAIFAMTSTFSVRSGFRADLVGTIINNAPHITIKPAPVDSGVCYDEIEKVLIDRDVIGISRVSKFQALAIGPRSQMLTEVISVDGPLPPNIMSHIDSSLELNEGFLVDAQLARKLGIFDGVSTRFIRPVVNLTGDLNLDRFSMNMVGTFDLDRQVLGLPSIYKLSHAQTDTAEKELWLFLEDPENIEIERARLKNACEPDSLVTTWQEKNSAHMKSLHVESNVMAIIVGLIVAASGMAVFSGFIMLTINKSATIAVLKTIGYSHGDIVTIFGLSASLIWVVSYTLGTLLAYFLLTNIDGILVLITSLRGIEGSNYVLPVNMQFEHFLRAAIISMLTVCLAILPALRSALLLSPTESFRRSD